MVTDDILAMSRPALFHFCAVGIVKSFKELGICAVVNLEEPGEHSFCGPGTIDGGYSYDPEWFMQHDIFYYNFSLPDFKACDANRLLDIVKVVAFTLRSGKIAIHCHAGHGRTGMVIAGTLMYIRGITPQEAVRIVREKRRQSVQSQDQINALHSFHDLLHYASIVPNSPCSTISEYICLNSRVLYKAEMRKFGTVPKAVFVSIMSILRRFFTDVQLSLESFDSHFIGFRFECNKPTGLRITEDTAASIHRSSFIRKSVWFSKKLRLGMNIINLEHHIENETDFREVICFLDFFFRISFFQLTTMEEITALLGLNDFKTEIFSVKDWMWCLLFLLTAVSHLPVILRRPFCLLISSWFIRKEALTECLLQWVNADHRENKLINLK